MSRPMHEVYRPRGPIRASRGNQLTCKNWDTEAALRMLMNNLDPEVALKPEDLIVYGGSGRAARNWLAYSQIVDILKKLDENHTLCVQSGKPVYIAPTHPDAPRVIIANSNLVPKWATQEQFDKYDEMGLRVAGSILPPRASFREHMNRLLLPVEKIWVWIPFGAR